jgi:Activator of Hsp90 ATPase homolog 1-like protein
VIEPLRLTFELDCAPDHAFGVWTERIDAWWPADHSASGADGLLVVLEPRVGGRLFERTAEGEEIEWGEITAWEPPRRFGYLWHLRRDRADATDVEIHFDDRGDGGTVVRIEHRGWERLGADGQRWHDANRNGWGTLLPHFVEYVESGSSPGGGDHG